MPLRILFLVPYPENESPSQRFRFEQYFDLLKRNQISFDIQSFLSSAHWKIFYGPGNIFKKIGVLLLGFFKRGAILFKMAEYEYVFIHREAAPVGPPFIEWIIANLWKKKIIYDFDDAIWLTDRQDESIFMKTIKWRGKVKHIIHWSYKISCGNLYLCDYAYQSNHNVFLNPTTIETSYLHDPDLYPKISKNHVTIGWTGSHSTLKYLDQIKSVLQQIEDSNPNVVVMIIADREPSLGLKRMVFRPWNRETEIADLNEFDIGIMPLTDDLWAEGKCGFKALQYMAMKIPAVVSPVGVNTTIIDHKINGFLASTPQEWTNALEELIHSKKLRQKMGEEGREKVIRNYSVRSNSNNFLSLFT